MTPLDWLVLWLSIISAILIVARSWRPSVVREALVLPGPIIAFSIAATTVGIVTGATSIDALRALAALLTPLVIGVSIRWWVRARLRPHSGCPQCGYDTSRSALFCPECGTVIPRP